MNEVKIKSKLENFRADMSIWTEIKGTVKIKQRHRVSLRKLLEENLTDEMNVHVRTVSMGEVYLYKFEGNICLDAEETANGFQKMIKSIPYEKGTLEVELKGRILG